jgi:hypothetical protein
VEEVLHATGVLATVDVASLECLLDLLLGLNLGWCSAGVKDVWCKGAE